MSSNSYAGQGKHVLKIEAKLDKELRWIHWIQEPPQTRWHLKPLHMTHENDEVFYLDLVFLHLFITLNPRRLTSHYTHTPCNPFFTQSAHMHSIMCQYGIINTAWTLGRRRASHESLCIAGLSQQQQTSFQQLQCRSWSIELICFIPVINFHKSSISKMQRTKKKSYVPTSKITY